MNSQDRKARIAKAKERKPAPGVYAIRCPASGQIWVGSAEDVQTVRARHWFSLRFGSHTNRAMQAAWATHGEAGFLFEPLELLLDEDNAIVRSSQLRDAARSWRNQLLAPAA